MAKVDDKVNAVLPSSMMEGLVVRLLREMMRSIGSAYTTRSGALTQSVRTPALTPVVSGCVEAVVHEPGARGVIDPISLLAEVHDRAAFQSLLAMLVMEEGVIQAGAAHALLNLLVKQALPAGEVNALEGIIGQLRCERSDHRALTLAEMLARRLPMSCAHSAWSDGRGTAPAHSGRSSLRVNQSGPRRVRDSGPG